MVLSKATASTLTRMICRRCNWAKTRSSIPLFAHRFIRVYDGVPVAELLGQTAPFAPVLGDRQDGVQHLPIVKCHVAAWCRQTAFDVTILGVGEFHVRSIA